MAPETQHLHDLLVIQHLDNETVLDVDSAGTRPFQISHQGFVGGRLLIGIRFE